VSVPALRAVALTKSFGGLRATAGASFEVAAGSVTALIGPNGAGKTTLFNLVTNLFPADSGEVFLHGRSLKGLAPRAVARLGLIRTFQSARIFPGMTTLENVLAGAHMRLRSGALAQMFWLPRARAEERALAARARALLALAGLAGFTDAPASELPMGGQKILELMRALMAGPRVLLLDEPAAGLNDSETARLGELIVAVRDAGITVMVVEHNMSLVMGIADQVIVLDAGAVVAAGTPRGIAADRRVIEAYVGRDDPGSPAGDPPAPQRGAG